jgi:hypothetical protein
LTTSFVRKDSESFGITLALAIAITAMSSTSARATDAEGA